MILVAGATLTCLACAEQNPSAENTAPRQGSPDSATTPSPFFPIGSFLKSEVRYVDSLPVGIKKYTSAGPKLDSVYITPEEFHQLSGEFVNSDLDEDRFQKNFTETSFFDQSSNNATFLYTARDPSTPLKRVDVVTTPGDAYDEIKSVYMEKNISSGDSTIIKKLMWKPKRHFQVITIISVNDQAPKNKTEKVVWDNRE